MHCLTVIDVEQIVRLVSQAGDPMIEMPVPERKRMLLESVAGLVGADIWYWSTTVFDPSLPGDMAATSFVDGGWISADEPARFYRALSDPQLRPVVSRLFDAYGARHVTLSRESMLLPEERSATDAVWSQTGIGHFLVSFYPLGEYASSGIGLYRRLGKPAFTARDQAVMHVVFHQVDWLHRHGTDVPAKDKVLNLSRREREVMVFLLGGDSQKEVAQKLKLSEHTVGDYVKQIYKHFSVSSRGELLAHFISGGQR